MTRQQLYVEVNSETDFVAKNETFQQFVKAVAEQAVESDAADMDAFMAETWNEDASKTVKDALVEKVAVIGENLSIRRFEKVVATNGCVVSYVHGGGRIGVLVEAETACCKRCCRRSFNKPCYAGCSFKSKICFTEMRVSEEYIAHEKEILLSSDHERSKRVPETGESDRWYDRRTCQAKN